MHSARSVTAILFEDV